MEMVMMRGDFLLWEAALVFAVTKWLLSFVMNFLSSQGHQSSCCSSSTDGLRMVKESLFLTTIEEMEHRQQLKESNDLSCAVCLNDLRKDCQVWELRNCNHVFHKDCLERWISHDNRLTCPLCRASLLPINPLPSVSLPQQPSWAVERMLYLFGDDLLP